MLLYEKPRSISNIRHPRGEKNPPLSAAPAPTPLAGDAVDDDGFTDLGLTTAATYEDKRPVKTPGTAEWREYRAKFWDGTEVSGAWSEVVKVTVEG